MPVQKIYSGAGNVIEVGQAGAITTTTTTYKITNIFHSSQKKNRIYFNVCPPEHPFTGRTTELELLDDAMQRSGSSHSIESQISVVSGLGGIGKTQLVREYVSRNIGKYNDNVIWINGDKEESIIEAFKVLANEILCISIVGANGTDKNIESIVRDVYEYFSGQNFLIVYDNVESMESIRRFLLLGPNDTNTRPYVVITSRLRQWHTGIAVIQLGEWQPDEAIDFVSKIIVNARENAEDVALLVKDLQYFPLALRQATSYIFHRGDTINNYRAKYEKQKKQLLDSKWFQNSVSEYTETTFTTWNITMKSIEQDTEFGSLALTILNTIAYFHADNISRASLINLIDDSAKESTRRSLGKYFIRLVVSQIFSLPVVSHTHTYQNYKKKSLVDNEELLESAVRLLIKYSMITSQESQMTLSIHRVVQDVIKVSLKMKGEEKKVLRNALLLIEKLMKRVEHTTHAISVFEHSLDYPDLVREFCQLPNTILMNLITNLMKEDAPIFVNRFVKRFETILGLNHPVLAKINFHVRYVNAYNFNRSLSINETGYQMYEELYKIRAEEFGPQDVDTIKVKFEIGQILLRMGKVKEAFAILTEANQQIEVSLGYAHPETIASEEMIAVSCYASGLYVEALERLNILHEKKRSLFGDNSTKTLFTLSGIGGVLLRQQKYTEALDVLQKVCQNNVELDENHETRLRAMENMAHAYNKLGKYDDAIEIFNVVLERRTNTLGQSHPDTLWTIADLGVVLLDQWKLEEAIEIFQKMCSNSSQEDSEATVITMKNMGLAFTRMGDYVKAEKIYNDVLSKRIKHHGKSHPDYFFALNDIGELFLTQEKFVEALPIFEEIYENRKVLGKKSEVVVLSMNNIAYAHSMLKNNDKALELYKKSHLHRTGTLGENHPDTLEISLEIARVLETMGNYTDALLIYESVNEKKIELGAESLIVRVAASRMGLAFGRSGKYTEGLQILTEIHENSRKLGDNHPATLCASIDIGLLHIDQKNYTEALETFYDVYDKASKISQNNEYVVIAARRVLQAHLALRNYIQSWRVYRVNHAKNIELLEGSHLGNVREYIDTAIKLFKQGDRTEAFLILMDIYLHRMSLDIADKDLIIGGVRKNLTLLYGYLRSIRFIQKHLV